jgi:xylem cysteine proteinase
MRKNSKKLFSYLFLFLILSNFISANLYSGTLHPVKQIMRYHMDSSPVEAFKIWHYLHNREYKFDSMEGLKRYEIFIKNFNIVKEHNIKLEKNYSLGLNNFADMTVEEFKDKYLVTNGRLYSQIKKLNIPNKEMKLDVNNFWDLNLPEQEEDAYMELFLENKKNSFNYKNNFKSFSKSKNEIDFHTIDWTDKAQLHRKVENQKNCGSCWAFSTIQSIQAAYTIKTGNYINLSKQQLVDCDNSSKGCDGGIMHTAMDYIKQNGIKLEDEYQYTGIAGECQLKQDSFFDNKNKSDILKISSYEGCIDKEECMNDESLFEVLTRGPVSAVVDASEEFMLYDEGIFDKPCKEANHAILLTGYFMGEKQQGYWVVKNSWGPVWGDHGFIKIKHSKDYNSCLLNSYYVRPDI